MVLYAGIDVVVQEISLPLYIKGFLKEDKDIYYIYINSNISQEQKIKALNHEYLHLVYRDTENTESAEILEGRCKQR